MTVKELIEELQKYESDLEVLVEIDGTEQLPFYGVVAEQIYDDLFVVLTGASSKDS